MKTAPPPSMKGLGIKLNALGGHDDDDDDDDDDMSVATGMTARGGKKKMKKRKKGSKGKKAPPGTSSKGHATHRGHSTSRRGSAAPHTSRNTFRSPMSRTNSSDALSTARSDVTDASDDPATVRGSARNLPSSGNKKHSSLRASFNTVSSGISDASEELDLHSLKGGKNVKRLLRGSVGGDDDLDTSEAIAQVMLHLRLDPTRVAELARVLESGGVGGQVTDRRLQVR